jgi:hypothetical protein
MVWGRCAVSAALVVATTLGCSSAGTETSKPVTWAVPPGTIGDRSGSCVYRIAGITPTTPARIAVVQIQAALESTSIDADVRALLERFLASVEKLPADDLVGTALDPRVCDP